ARAETEATRMMLKRVEESDRSIQMAESRRRIAEKGETRTQDDVAVHPETDVIFLFGQLEKLVSERRRLVEFASVEVERGGAAQHGETPWPLPDFLGEVECPAVCLFHLWRIAADRDQPSRQARLQRDLLACAVRGRWSGRERSEQVVREPDCSVIPTASVVEHPERVEKTVELFEVSRLDPVSPGGEEIGDLERELRERVVALGPGQVIPSFQCELREVLGVRPPSPGAQLRILVQALDGIFTDRLEHPQSGTVGS